MLRPRLLALLLLAPLLAGCLQNALQPAAVSGVTGDLDDGLWDTTGNFSKPLTPPLYDVLPAEVLPMTSFDGVEIQTAVWRPDVPEGQKVPVILEIGPYWGDSIDQAPSFFGEFFVDQFVTRGYAYAQVAVRGTAGSGGCMEFFGPNEQKDIDEVVTFYGEQPWSNGNVGIIGGSYDGTTPWVAASYGNPYLKTIVPISGLTDVAGLMFRNGTSEGRGPIMHSVVYWTLFGMGAIYGPGMTYRADHWDEQVCEEFLAGAVEGPRTALTGDRRSEYWEIRDWRERVKENYEGSVYLVHGMQDWNVEPTMAFPFVTELQQEEGLDVKMMLGQWGHDLPDRASREAHVRWDWGQKLLDWFDQELKGEARDQGALVDIEDNYGLWRTESTWPPADAAWTTFHLGEGVLSRETTEAGERTLLNPAGLAGSRSGGACLVFACVGSGALPVTSPTQAIFDLGAVEEDLRFAGLAQLHVTVTPSNPNGGHLFAELLDVGRGGQTQRVAHAVMDLRYHAGGHDPQTLSAGESVVAKMEFFPADVLIPKGHRLVLRVLPDTPFEPLPSHTPTPITLHWGEGSSVLNLPVIVRDVGDGRYPGQPLVAS